MCPIYSITTQFDNDGQIVSSQKKTNYCSTKCLQQYAFNLAVHFPSNSVYLAYVPIGKLEMCQFCGFYSHPSEFCHAYGTPSEICEDFQTIGNKTGEWAPCYGNVVYGIMGTHCNLEITKAYYTSTMCKLDTENVKDRYPLVYFWWSEDSCQELLNDIQAKDTPPLPLDKEVIIDIKPVYAQEPYSDTTTILLHETTKLHNPNKLFFPYDIREENCWWPKEQSFMFLKETFHVTPNVPYDTNVIEYDPQHLFKYDEEEFTPEVNAINPEQEIAEIPDLEDEEEEKASC